MPFPKKIRFYFRLTTVIVKKYYLTIILGAVLGGLLAFLIYSSYAIIVNNLRSVKKVGLVGQYSLTNLPDIIQKQLSFGLTNINDSGEISPGIADTWKVSDDNKTYEFFVIPEKYRWSDGRQFSLNDITYNFQDVEITRSDRTIKFSLKEPFSPLLLVLSKPIFSKNMSGLGDYKIKDYVMRGNTIERISLKYLGDQKLPNIAYRFYPTVGDMLTGFNLGEINYLDSLFSTNEIFTSKNTIIEPYIDLNVFTAMYFNTEIPELSNKSTRQSLSYAIRKPTDDSRSISSYSPLSWVFNDSVKQYLYDTNRSTELVTRDEFSNMRELVIATFPQDINLAQEIINDWSEIGVKAKVITVNVMPENYDLLLVSREIPLEADQYPYWHSTQAGNLSKLRNPRLDKLLEDGRKTYDREARKNIYLDFQRYLLEECPAVFLSHPTMYRVSRT